MKQLFMSLLLCVSISAQATYHTKKYHKPHAKGLQRTEKSKNFINQKKSLKRAEIIGVIPGHTDLTPRVSPPEDQGQCGSCWDFSITKSLRSALMLVNNDPGQLSFNYLLNNCGPGPAQGGCNGGDFDAMESFLQAKHGGNWSSKHDPYTEQEGACKKGLPVIASALSYEFVGNGQTAPSFKELAWALSQQHMLVVDVAVCGDWENYAGGIFNSNQCGPNSINHMINMNGYDCQTSVDMLGNCVFNAQGEPINGDGYLIVMNNWGTQWGENGTMRTRAHMDAVATTAAYFTVEKPTPPAPPKPPTPPAPPSPPPHHRDWFLIAGISTAVLIVIGGVVRAFKRKGATK